MIHADTAKEMADQKHPNVNADYLEDGILDGIGDSVNIAASNGEYSMEYQDETNTLSDADLRHCQGELEDAGYKVEVDYSTRTLRISW